MVIFREMLAIALALWGLAMALELAEATHALNGFYQDDDITHYFMARDGWNDPVRIWSNWSRPGYSLPTMVVAHFWGMMGCRVFSCLQTALVGYLAYRIALLLLRPMAPRRCSLRDAAVIAAPLAAAYIAWRIGEAALRPLAPGQWTFRSLALAAASLVAAWLVWRVGSHLLRSLKSPRFSPADLVLFLVPAAAPVLVWAQPMTTLLSLTTLTETPASLYVALAVWLYLRGNRVWGCAAMSLCFVTRVEMAALAPVFVAAVIWDALRLGGWKAGTALRQAWPWAALGALAWAPLTWIVVGEIIALAPYLKPLASFTQPYGDYYGAGTVYQYFRGWLLEAGGAGVLAAAAAGAVVLGRRAFVPTAIALGLSVLHTVIYVRGSFESGGYMRFLVPMTGLVGALAACGAGLLLTGRRRVAIIAALAVAACWLHWGSAWDRPMIRKMIDPLLKSPALQATARVEPRHPDAWERWCEDLPGSLALEGTLGEAVRALERWYENLTGSLVLLTLAAAVTAATVRNRHVRLLVGWGALWLGWTAARTQFDIQAKPLELNREWVQVVAVQAVNAMDYDPKYASRPAITGYPVIAYLRKGTHMIGSYESGIALWEQAAPGTLYFWENKYGYNYAFDMRLRDSLGRLGELLWQRSGGKSPWTGTVEVYARLPDRPATTPATSAAPRPAP
jgi:hypothetical protein